MQITPYIDIIYFLHWSITTL